jgi:rSAM/selenodomain-associated transferase 1
VNEQSSPVVRSGPALVYFAKAPRPGQVKTRLCPPLYPEEAAALYASFLRRIVRPQLGAATYLYGAPADALAELAPFAPSGVELCPQRGADLWARLINCFAELFGAGHDRVVVRNTDSPDLPRERVTEALAVLRPGRVVLGPDPGGGYYLIGLAAAAPELFQLGDGSASDVFARTRAQAERLGLALHCLQSEPDVDTYSDLLALWAARVTGSGR